MGEQWSTTQEDEVIYRRTLFAAASKGDMKAKTKLQQNYAVKIWSEGERERLVYLNSDFEKKSRRRK